MPPLTSTESPVTPAASARPSHPLREVALLFLRLGFTAFGGPAAHIAMMDDEVVRKRKWMSRESFLDLLGATNLIPGPNSTEMAMHAGRVRAGNAGLLVAGACFIVPAALIVTLIAVAYVRYGTLPAVEPFLYGMKPVIIAIIAHALWSFMRSALPTGWKSTLFGLGVLALMAGWNEMVVLGAGAVFAMGIAALRRGGDGAARGGAAALVGAVPATVTATVAGAASFSLSSLFLIFLKIGSILFGSGYVLLAFLRADLVERLHWLTSSQLLDAITVGQITPGPLFTTATFIGYVLGGPVGAAVATLGIFLPSFFFVGISGPLIPLIRRSKILGAALDGLSVVSLSLMAFVTFQLARVALVDVPTILIAVVALVILVMGRVPSVYLLVAGAVAGWAMGPR